MSILKVPGYPFYHGVLMVDGCMSTLFYFEDVNMGLVSIVMPNQETRFCRVTTMTEQQMKSLETVN